MSVIQTSKHSVTNVCCDSLCCALLATVLIAPFKQSMRNYFIILSLGILSLCTIGEVLTEELNFRGFQLYEGLNTNLRGPIKECRSVDIRNECQNFADLNGCTVIKGTLKVVLLPKGINPLPCNYSNYRFPLLREVTEYVIFYDVHGLTTIRDMFPSLTVIRGRRLFLNYALGVSNMPDLEAVEFRSLIAIQRGHVYIGSSKKLCQLERINFDRLTLTPGENHIFPDKNLKCEVKVLCRGCKSGYCWSNRVCQKFENDKVINMMQDPQCDSECFGGCFNSSNTGCGVCKGLTYHGACVAKCPPDTFVSELHMRCYTREECQANKLLVYEHEDVRECVQYCPNGFNKHPDRGECVKCSAEDLEGCLNICNHNPNYGVITIYSIADAEFHKGCHLINSSLIITIRNKIDEKQLADAFSDLREIRGYLKIYRSQYITSLNFLSNLRIIHGSPIEDHLYAMVIYDNRNLRELWPPHAELKIMNGSMFLHRNEKLCNQVLQKFRTQVFHDRAKDSIQVSDQEVLCGPAKLSLTVKVKSHREFQLFWPISQTVERVEVLYRYLPARTKYVPETELDTHICQRNDWVRRLLFADEIAHNKTHYEYTVKVDRKSVDYEVLVKTFDTTGQRDARSEVRIVALELDNPPQPLLSIANTTNSSITINVSTDEQLCRNCVEYYAVEVYELLDDVDILNSRDYCAKPIADYNSYYENGNLAAKPDEDIYEDCCARKEELVEESEFLADIQNDYACRRDQTKECLSPINDNEDTQLLRRLRLDPKVKNYTLERLEHFRMYSIQVKACNLKGCSYYAILNERTKLSKQADRIENFYACKVPTNSTPIEYQVYFAEPKIVNGAIVAYVLHYREYIKGPSRYKSHLSCVTRSNHVQNNYRAQNYLYNNGFNQVSIHIFSLSGDVKTKWVNITNCNEHAEEYEAIIRNLNNKDATDTSKSTPAVHTAGVFIPILWCAIVALVLLFVGLLYKQRYGHRLAAWYRNLRWRQDLQDVIFLEERNAHAEDQEILVVGHNRVRYRNPDLMEEREDEELFP